MRSLKVKPDPERPGLIVRDPLKGEPLPAKGREVEDSPYWRRRLTAGDAVPVESKTKPKET